MGMLEKIGIAPRLNGGGLGKIFELANLLGQHS